MPLLVRPTVLVPVGGVLVLAGLGWLVAAGADASRFHGFFLSDPACLVDGSCTPETLDTLATQAWWGLLPPAGLVLVGLVPMLVGLAHRPTTTQPEPSAGSPGRPVALTTAAVGVFAALPAGLMAWVAPPLGAALLGSVGVLLLVLLVAVAGRRVGRRGAVPVALAATLAAAATGAASALAVWSLLWPQLSITALVAAGVPPIVASGLAAALVAPRLGLTPRSS